MFTYTTSKEHIEFKHENSMVVFMALECIDQEFSWSFYCDYMTQFDGIPTLPEYRYEQLVKIVSNQE